MDFKIPLILFVFLFTLLSSSQAFKFYVGGSDGWTLNPSQNYNQWAARNRFQIKDTIVFKYKKGSDSVLEVKKEDYEKCIKTNPIKKLEEGETELTLDRSGPFYFISGKDENCEKGQKLSLVVLSQRKQTQTPTVPPPISSPSPSGSPTAYTPSVSPSPIGNSPSVSPYPASTPPTGGPTASSPSSISTPPAGVPPATSPSPISTPPAGGPTATSPTSAPAGGPAALSPSLSPASAPASGPASSSTSPTSAPAGGPAATPPSPSPTSTTPISSPPSPGTPSSPSPTPAGAANPPGSSSSTATAPAPAPSKSSGASVASSRFLMYSVTIVVGAALLCHGTVLG
ncbi:uncharacterized protein [Cicer arietinum]|uniref:Early nodulin-like protein 2 n=1 Tax=Cicer arietinum TaxID=3827 RepID=A0A1S2YUA2_CICAR|nr:early nodulin-like protein 2 [Cicer arietinum]